MAITIPSLYTDRVLSRLPPGPRYLLSKPTLPILAFLIYATNALSNSLSNSIYQSHHALPTGSPASASLWIKFPLFCILTSTLIAVHRYTRFWREARRARAVGAEVVPAVGEAWPSVLGVGVMKEVMRSFRDGYPAEVFLDWMKEYGNTFQLRAPTDSRIITFEPDHIKAILATQFENFIKGDIFKAQMDSLLGVGVFNSDGEMWKFHRSMTRPFFTRERISDFETFDTHAEEALHLARGRLREGYPIDFQDLAARFTLDSASSFLFGNDVRSLEAGLAYPPSGTAASQPLPSSPPSSASSNKSHNQNHTFETHPSNTFVHAFQSAQLRSAFRTRLGEQWALAEFWGDKVRKERGIVDGFVEAVLERGVREWEEEEERKLNLGIGEKGNSGKAEGEGEREREGKEDVTLLQHLVRTTQDRKILKDELVNLLVAGRDTSATLLTFALYALTQHPHVESKLRNEVISKVGYSRRPDYEDMKELKYLRAFVNEVLRLYPPVPFDSRVSVNETIWESKTPEGEVKKHYIPASTRILYGVMYMQRRKDLWGPDAEEFDPDRFIDSRLQKYLIPNPYIFCPFNAGPRICLGQQFAYHETSFFLIRLIQQFTNFRLAEDAMTEDTKPPKHWREDRGRFGGRVVEREKVWPSSHLTLYVKGGLWIRMDEVRSEERTA